MASGDDNAGSQGAAESSELAELNKAVVELNKGLRGSAWTKVAPIIISALSALTAIGTVALNYRSSQQSRALDELSTRQENNRKELELKLASAASKRSDATLVSSYVTALVSPDKKIRRLAYNSVYYALGKELADQLLEGLFDDTGDGEEKLLIAQAVANGATAEAASSDASTKVQQPVSIAQEFISKNKVERLSAFGTVLSDHIQDPDVLKAVFDAASSAPAPAVWNAMLLAKRIDPDVAKKVGASLPTFLESAAKVQRGEEGTALIQAARTKHDLTGG